MITKFKIFEGIRWYHDGKLGKVEEESCDHAWFMIHGLNKNFKKCALCKKIEKIENECSHSWNATYVNSDDKYTLIPAFICTKCGKIKN